MIEANLFTLLDRAEAQALEAAVERFGRFMELPATLQVGVATERPG